MALSSHSSLLDLLMACILFCLTNLRTLRSDRPRLLWTLLLRRYFCIGFAAVEHFLNKISIHGPGGTAGRVVELHVVSLRMRVLLVGGVRPPAPPTLVLIILLVAHAP